MKTEKEIQDYMRLEHLNITVVSKAEQNIFSNPQPDGGFDPQMDTPYIHSGILYFTISEQGDGTIYEIDGEQFEDEEEFLMKLEEALKHADYPTDSDRLHEVLSAFESKQPADSRLTD